VSEVLDSASEVLDSAGEVLNSASEVLSSVSEVLSSAGEVLNSVSEVLSSAGGPELNCRGRQKSSSFGLGVHLGDGEVWRNESGLDGIDLLLPQSLEETTILNIVRGHWSQTLLRNLVNFAH
jgi:hypothetical protein